MATQTCETDPATVQDPEVQAETPPSDPGQTSTDMTENNNRLIQYIRSMPLVSILFSRSISNDSFSNVSNRIFVYKCLMSFHLLILVALVVLTSFAIYYYNIRFYKIQTRPSETLIVCWLLRAIWHTVNSSWSLRYHYIGARNGPNLKLSQTFYNIASILWISLTVVFLGVSPREDLKTVSSRICYFLLWLTIASYVVPMLAYTFICILLYVTLLIVIYFRHGSIPLTSTAMPVSLLKKLKVERYRDVLKKIDSLEESVELGENYTNTSESETTVSQDSQQDQNSSETKSKPPKDVLFECVNNSEMLDEHLCSICILNINDVDKVFLLPCDMRHLFHRDCLKKWFKRSSECPICRTNITQILSKKDKEKQSKKNASREPENDVQELNDVVTHSSSTSQNSPNNSYNRDPESDYDDSYSECDVSSQSLDPEVPTETTSEYKLRMIMESFRDPKSRFLVDSSTQDTFLDMESGNSVSLDPVVSPVNTGYQKLPLESTEDSVPVLPLENTENDSEVSLEVTENDSVLPLESTENDSEVSLEVTTGILDSTVRLEPHDLSPDTELENTEDLGSYVPLEPPKDTSEVKFENNKNLDSNVELEAFFDNLELELESNIDVELGNVNVEIV
ncbi:Ring finger domain protein [Theileria parva strain Muguga]|uniref:Ring finger domain protein n=1 Tax=Theileria parva strain Muguga TaxID=333668 RepID=UPI001C62244A|nr:Ring finger domain protein [Theileria parva strain Muguga]EAN32463.2 Ring finger domain protein [Theileria parva strain Muguga]